MKPWRYWVGGILICGACFFGGWYAEAALTSIGTPFLPLRLSGYEYISPLLACNSRNAFPQAADISGVIEATVNGHKNAGDITSASTYFADFSTGKWSIVNGSDKYYPSSLGKVPIMMAYFELADSSSTLLEQKITYPLGSVDLNAKQEIKPEQPIVPGNIYTVRDLITYMIKGSDNNAAQLLFSSIDQGTLTAIYSDLQIPTNNGVETSTIDFMTPQQYAILFRTLYNATYLSRDFSQSALQLLAQTNFTQGLVAGVSSSTKVAHKFGIVSTYTGGMVTSRELHDCGMVYAKGHTYLLCVMTRGSSPLANMEKTIADISRAVYATLEP